jgi:Domain of unknown function (DUF4412)
LKSALGTGARTKVTRWASPKKNERPRSEERRNTGGISAAGVDEAVRFTRRSASQIVTCFRGPALRWAFGLCLFVCADGCKTKPSDGASASNTQANSANVTAGGPGALLGDGPFEGEIAFDVRKGETIGTAVYRIKGAKVRLEIGPNGGAAGGAIVYDALRYRGGIYGADGGLVLPIGSGARAPEPSSSATIERTGKSEAVAGYLCELWNVTDKQRTIQACVVDGVAWGSGYAQLVSWLPRGKFFVLRVVERDLTGVETFRVLATKVTRGPQSEVLFDVPEIRDAGGN